jgi:hypothetical protein
MKAIEKLQNIVNFILSRTARHSEIVFEEPFCLDRVVIIKRHH